MEAVAAARRGLPAGGVVPEDYVFEGAGPNGEPTPTRLSELFAPGRNSLVIYNMMFPRDPGDRRPNAASGTTARLSPCSRRPALRARRCSNQLEGAAEHVAPRLNFVVVAKARIGRLVAFAKERGWRRMRLVSSAKNTFNRDYHGEDANGVQRPMLNVFSREGDVIRHFWGSELFFAPTNPGQDPRHVGTIEPVWNLFNLTREGRQADWDEQLQYPATPTREPG